jgi:hypothetical protein
VLNTFIELARDPRLIPGVYQYCDEWCDICPVANRCLAFRCTAAYRKQRGRRDGEPTFRTTAEAAAFTRAVAAAQGLELPDFEAPGRGRTTASGFPARDPLAERAWQYAVTVSMWLVFEPGELRQMRQGGVPSPEEVVLWYHLRIYLKLGRALLARERLAGTKWEHDESNGCAKLVLVSVQRSRKALMQLKRTAASDTVDTLLPMLDLVEQGIHERFPNARSYVRAGLDVTVG